MPLDVRDWTCPHCGIHHDRDGNAAINIRTQGIRMLKAEGSAVWCCRRGSKTKNGTKVSFEAFAYEYRSPHRIRQGRCWVVHVALLILRGEPPVPLRLRSLGVHFAHTSVAWLPLKTPHATDCTEAPSKVLTVKRLEFPFG